MRLALKLGHVNVDKMLQEISLKQLKEWMAFQRIDPFDNSRADLRAASIVAQMSNMFRKPNSPAKPITDFLIYGKPKTTKKVTQTPQDIKLIAYMLAASTPPIAGKT